MTSSSTHQLDTVALKIAELDQASHELADHVIRLPPRDLSLLENLIHSINQKTSEVKRLLGTAVARQHRIGFHRPAQRRRLDWSQGELLSELQRWPRIRTLIEEVLREEPIPLFPASPPPRSLAGSQIQLADELFNLLHLAVTEPEQEKTAFDALAFADIGLHNSQFVELMHAAYRIRLAMGEGETSFLDIGCGTGTKVLCASWFFREVAGIELDPGYASAARRLFVSANLSGARLFEQNAFEYEDFENHDVVYMFRPISDDEILYQLEQKMIQSVKPGTLIAAPYKGFLERHERLNCGHLGNRLFVAHRSQQETEEMGRLATYTGTAVHPPQPSSRSLWQPILSAAHSVGFDLPRKRALQDV